MKAPKEKWRPRLWTVMAMTSALILGLTIGFIVLAYRVSLESAYEKSLRSQLSASLSLLAEGGFSEESAHQVRNQGIRLLILSNDTQETLYQDPGGQPQSDGQNETHRLPHQGGHAPLHYDVQTLVALIQSRLGGEDGSFFSTDLGDDAPGGRLENKTLYLIGRSGAYLYCLFLPVESTNAAINIAIRFATYVGILTWLISVALLYFVSKGLTRPHKRIVQAAGQIAEMDFSQRCPSAFTRELNELSNSVNRMADRLQSNVERLYRVNDQLQVELDERNRQQQIELSLIADLSHDLKTPIGVISGYAEGLQEGIAATPEQQQLYCSMILKESEHMQSIVSKLLYQSRLDSQSYPIEPEEFDLAELLDDVISIFQMEIRRLGLTMEKAYQGPLPVYTDYESVRQSVVNYVQNAIYHINHGTRIRISVNPLGELLRVCVANSSLPIPPEERDKIWKRLYRGDPSRKRHPGGAGLGLSIVKGNMKRLGMEFGQSNRPDGMVEFWLCVPGAGGDPGRPSAEEGEFG